MKLIREEVQDVRFIVEEKVGKKKDYFIEGIFLQADLKNKNGRMYPSEVMDKEVSRYMEETVNNNRAFGELGHPDGPGINLHLVSHMITELNKQGSNYFGRAKILETPNGMIARGLLDGGANLGVSSRAIGTLKENKDGVQVVQDDFTLSTAADIVADPSAPDAFVRGIMEGKEWVFVNGKFVEKHIDEVKRVIRTTSSKNLTEAKVRAFQNFLSKIK